MKITKHSQSVIDYLFQILPNNKSISTKTNAVDDQSAKILYSLWRTAENKQSNKVYKKPVTMSWYDVEKLETQGLAKRIQDNIEITDKGSKVLRVMILGNNTSIFDKDGLVNYSTALTNMVNTKQAKNKNSKVASQEHWWDKFLK